jgi:lipopolysaccharide biosynthesis regulator YciM
MGAALVLLLVALGAMAAGVLIGRYYVPDDRQLRRTARHSRAYMRALSHLIARDHETVMAELRAVVEENVEDVEPYFALGALFRSRGEHERAIRVHQALAVRERERRKLRQRAMYELGLDFRAAGMPRRATRAMEKVVVDEPGHEGALRALAALYEEQARFNEAAGMWQRLGRRRGEDLSHREHHLLVAAAQTALGRDDPDSAKQLLKSAQKLEETPHFYAAAAELAAARGNHRGAKERLKQALTADPALVPHLLPGLIAAEQGLAAQERAGRKGRRDGHEDDDLADLSDEPALPALSAAAPPPLPAAVTAPPVLPASRGDSSTPVGGTGAAPSTTRSSADATASGSAVGVGNGTAASTTGSAAAERSSLTRETTANASLAGASSGAVPSIASAPALEAAARTAAMPSSTGGADAADAAVALVAAGGALFAETAPRPLEGVALVPAERPAASIAERVLAVLAELEAQSGPRLELALIRAQLVPPSDAAGQAAAAADLIGRFPDALAARVAAARLAIARGDARDIRSALDGLVADSGALAWTLRGRWQCAHCGNRPGPFSWRCAQCRRWGTLRMETGIEPPPVMPRDRRAEPRAVRLEGLLGVAPDQSLPAATLDAGLSDAERETAGVRRSLLGRVGGWFTGVLRRNAS